MQWQSLKRIFYTWFDFGLGAWNLGVTGLGVAVTILGNSCNTFNIFSSVVSGLSVF